MLETIKSYLVSLGFSVDKQSYGEATKAIDGAGENVAKFAGGAVKSFAIAGVAVTAFAASAVVGIAKFLDELGKSSIQNEMLARQMWTTEQNAMAFNSTLKAMGVSLQDLYLSPTLMSQFQQLRKEAGNLQAPAEYKNQMQMIQSISFEFKRMKLEATYALQWIGYYFIKYMSGPILQTKLTLSEINDVIIKKMPYWTKIVAQVMSWFAQFGITTVRAIKDVIKIFDDLGSGIPKNLKLIGAAVAALGLIIKTGPIGILIAVFTSAILLLNDFYTYLAGGESAFGPFWKKLIAFYDKLKESGGVIDRFKKYFTDAFTSFEKIIEKHKGLWDNLKAIAKDFGTEVKKGFDLLKGPVDWLGKTGLPAVTDGALSVLQGITDVIVKMDKFGGTEAIIMGIVGALAAWKFANFAVVASTAAVAFASKVLPTIELMIWGIKNATTAWQAAQWLLNVAMDANPIGVIVVAVGLLIAGLVLLAKNWDTVKKAAVDSLNWIVDKLNYLIKLIDKIPGIKIPLIPKLDDGGGSSKPPTPGYLFPNSNTQNNNNSNKVTLSQTNNIYGSDPKATADAVNNNGGSMLLRGMSGVIK